MKMESLQASEMGLAVRTSHGVREVLMFHVAACCFSAPPGEKR
jgi:hypothetical protein